MCVCLSCVNCVYENWVFTVTGGSFSLDGVVVSRDADGEVDVDVGVGIVVVLFDGDDAFICRMFIFED